NDEGLRKLEQQFSVEKGSLSYSEGGQLVHKTRGWAQEYVGEDFRAGLQQLAKKRYGETSPEAVQRLMKEDPEIKKAIETAMVERTLLGDVDFRDSNFRLVRGSDGKIKVENIDLDFAFKDNRLPEVKMPGDVGVTRQLAEGLSDQPLSAELRAKIATFLEKYDTPGGRAELAKMGLTPDEVDAYLARAKNMADAGKFPHVEPMDVPRSADRPQSPQSEKSAHTSGDNPPDARQKPARDNTSTPANDEPESIPDGRDTIPAPGRESPHPVDENEKLSIRRVLDDADIPAEERVAKLAEIRTNKLNAPDVLDPHVDCVRQMQAGWQSDVYTGMKQCQDELVEAEKALANELGANLPQNPDALRALANHDQSKLAVIEEYLAIRTK